MTYEEYKKLHPEDAENTAQKLHINLNNNQQNMQNNMQNLNNTNANQQPPQNNDAENNTTPKSIIPETKISKTFFNKHWFTKTNVMGKYIIVKNNLKGGLKSLSVLEKNNLGILPFHFTIPYFTSVATLYKECDYDYKKHKYPINKNGDLKCTADFKLRISIINPINFISVGNENEIIETKIEHDFDDIVHEYFNSHKIDVITGDIYKINSDNKKIIKDQSIIKDEIENLLKTERKFSPSQERLEMEEEKINNNNNYTNEEKINLIKKLNETKLTFEEYYGIRVNTLSLNYFTKPSISEEIDAENIGLERAINRQKNENEIQNMKNQQDIENAEATATANLKIGNAKIQLTKVEQEITTKNLIEQARNGVNVYNVRGIPDTATQASIYLREDPYNQNNLNQGQVLNENNDKQNSNTQNKNSNQTEILNNINSILKNPDISEESKIKLIEKMKSILQNSNENENENHKTK